MRIGSTVTLSDADEVAHRPQTRLGDQDELWSIVTVGTLSFYVEQANAETVLELSAALLAAVNHVGDEVDE